MHLCKRKIERKTHFVHILKTFHDKNKTITYSRLLSPQSFYCNETRKIIDHIARLMKCYNSGVRFGDDAVQLKRKNRKQTLKRSKKEPRNRPFG